ncbi:diguanylate cyclase [Castellaniella sp.]|uniref:transporter substrate-binding domain-containing diguanylate cyclase n=1 Tax=Castellaniella sp. TaxID=1955812 RepID=UPI00356402AB
MPITLSLIRLLVAWLLAGSMIGEAMAAAMTCRDGDYVALAHPVVLTEAERAQLPQAPLRVGVLLDAAPLSMYDAGTGQYTGISVDVFCFIARQLGLAYRFAEPSGRDLEADLQALQTGALDVLMPLSPNQDRLRHGLFTLPYYQAYYVAVARLDRDFEVLSLADLAGLRVGYFERSAIEPLLREHLPADALVPFAVGPGNSGIYAALQAGKIDVAATNKAFFEESRYQNDLFDLGAIYTFRSHPRDYGFYFSDSAQNRNLVAVFNKYLAAIDPTASLNEHEIGEARFIERYRRQMRQQDMLWLGIIMISLLLLILAASFWHYRTATRRLLASTVRIKDQQEALERANQQLERLSQTDSLTNLYNRRRFDLRSNDVYKAIQAGEIPLHKVAPLSMLLLDLDRFKVVNDLYGHMVGDDYLRKVADVLRQHCRREGDEVIRYGGEEFLCVLPATSAKQAFEIAERIRQAVLDLRCPNPTEIGEFLTISIGAVTSVHLRQGPEEMIQAADQQLYAAKHAGRNRTYGIVLD